MMDFERGPNGRYDGSKYWVVVVRVGEDGIAMRYADMLAAARDLDAARRIAESYATLCGSRSDPEDAGALQNACRQAIRYREPKGKRDVQPRYQPRQGVYRV
jgi:hypothetical protein